MKKILFILSITVIAFAGCELGPCDGVICLNGGQDVEQGDNCVCECPAGFEGANCENEITDPCANVECQNGGTCNTDGTCDCAPGYGGDNCNTLLCDVVLCENGGTCNNGDCDCPEGFSGLTCEVDDACLAIECLNGGTCSLGICACPDGFTGAGLQIANFGAFDPNLVFTAVSVSGNTISLALSEIMTSYGVYLVEGNGVLSDDAMTIDWTYTSTLDGVEDTCTGTWTRRP